MSNTIRNLIIVTVCFLATCTAAAYITSIVYTGRIGQLDQELGRSRADYLALEREYRAIEQSNISLGKRLDSIQRGIGEAKNLAESISGQGKTASEQVRIVIENLKKIRKILADIGNI